VGGLSARLAVADNPGLSGPSWYGPETPDGQGMVSWTVTGLTANRPYWWAVEVDGVLDTDWSGRFRTHPPVGVPASFTFAASSCAGYAGTTPGSEYIASQVSNHPVFDTILQADPLFLAHIGDMHYRNISTADAAAYRQAYDDVLTFNGTLGAQARQGRLYRNVPLVYTWDDHDYGPNNADGTYVGRETAAAVYRERVPHYPLPSAQGCYHSFQVGRLLFVMLDCRYFRSPSTTPDGPDKTMLGSEQIAWLQHVLTTSTADVLVVSSPVEWLGNPADGWDNWRGYSYERGVITQLFRDTGWANRMIMLAGDRHSMGMCSGGIVNPWGGWPVYMYSSLDSHYGTTTTDPYYDLGLSPGRGRYGLISVEDDGTQITITNRGFIGSDVWRSHSYSVGAPIPSPPLPPPTPAVARDSVTWLGCDLVSGRIIAELPEITGRISRVLGAYTSASLTLPIPLAGPGAQPISVIEAATRQSETMIVAVVNDVPTWAGIVLVRQGGSEGVLRLGCVTLEGYLNRRFVRNHTWQGMDEAAVIAAGLAADANIEGINLIIDAPATGRKRDRSYADQDDKVVYSALRELMAVENGPEWTIDLDWADAGRTAIAKILRVRSRIGAASATPDVVFDTLGDGSASYTYTEDYSDGRGANYVVATSSGEGESRPQSDPARDVPPGSARWEHRFSPSSSITSRATLNEHAAAELALRRDGARTVKINVRWDVSPRLNVDWGLGDDVAWHLVGPRHPDGLDGKGRVIGWELDIQAGLISPVLWEPGEGS